MRKDIAKFVPRCLTCQQVHTKHKHPGGLLQTLLVPKWKWEWITMDFVVGLLKLRNGGDVILVIVDRLMKSANFLPIRTTDSVDKLCQLYIDEIVCLHGVLISIISDQDSRFTSRYWSGLQEASRTKLSLSTTFHPQINGQSE